MSWYTGEDQPLISDKLSEIRERIEGKRIDGVDGRGDLILDDGTVLRLYESAQDCCASAYGDWVVEPDYLDAIITGVRYDLLADREDNGDGSDSRATITILHNQNPLALADCIANDGNGGYYFSVLSLSVVVPGREDDLDVRVVEA